MTVQPCSHQHFRAIVLAFLYLTADSHSTGPGHVLLRTRLAAIYILPSSCESRRGCEAAAVLREGGGLGLVPELAFGDEEGVGRLAYYVS